MINTGSHDQSLSFDVRRAQAPDAAAIYEVMRVTWLATYPNPELGISEDYIRILIEGEDGGDIPNRVDRWRQAIVDPDRKIFVGTAGDQIVGYVSPFFDTEEQRFRVGGLYVLPEAQGRGLGCRLLRAAVESMGPADAIYVHVAEYNTRAIDFYERQGFVQTNRELVANDSDARASVYIPQIEMVLWRGEHD